VLAGSGAYFPHSIIELTNTTPPLLIGCMAKIQGDLGTAVYNRGSPLQRHKKAKSITYNRLKIEIKTFKICLIMGQQTLLKLKMYVVRTENQSGVEMQQNGCV
jgi:hypothetical protein